MISTFVLPCKFNFAVYDSIRSIREHYPHDSEIIVIDSDSGDKQYIEHLREDGVIVEEACNKNFITGAIWYAFRKFKRERYYFLHDSMILKGRLDQFNEAPAVSIRYFNSGRWLDKFTGDSHGQNGFGFDSEESRLWGMQQLSMHTSYVLPDLFTGLFGSALICSREVLEKLDKAGFSKILPTQKSVEDQAMERLWGIALHNEGYDIKTNTVAGNHNDNPSTALIEKAFYVRQ